MRILVIRTSAMGDVALITPLLKGMRKQYPSVEIVLLTRSSFKSFFDSFDGLELIFPDFRMRHKGPAGLLRLFSDIKKTGKLDHIIDLHDVLRSKILRMLFRLSRVKCSVIDKGRDEKRSLIKGGSKKQLKHSVERYHDTFSSAGFTLAREDGPWIIPGSAARRIAVALMSSELKINIGVAPYARHKLKIWPEDKMVRLLELVSEKYNPAIWLFGGDDETGMLEAFQKKVRNTVNVTGKYSLEVELAIMSKLDLMIAMDSSNMHMAALVGTKVISVWGGTDPLTGFGAWMQPDSYSISIPVADLICRPCTIFGKGECARGDFACMEWLKPETVFERIEKLNIL